MQGPEVQICEPELDHVVGITRAIGKAAPSPDIGLNTFQAADRVEVFCQGPSLGFEGLEHVLKGLKIEGDREPCIGLCHRPFTPQGEPCYGLAGVGRHCGGGAVVQNLKAGRHASFDGKPPQQLFTKGVNGLNFKPAWGFQGPCEQGAGCRQTIAVIGF